MNTWRTEYEDPQIPYFAQWESRQLVGAILRRQMSATEDPRWRESGAESPEEYEFWSWRACGMACLKSVLMKRNGLSQRIVSLAKEVMAAGGYRLTDRGVEGLTYKPFVSYLSERWSIEATVEADLSLTRLADLLRDGWLVMASVSPRIRVPSQPCAERGGHLVLVMATDADDLVLHNPSGDTPETQESVRIQRDLFERFFAYRGVSLRM